MAAGLLLIDIQNDYFPGGEMVLHGSEEASQVAGCMLRYFRRRGWPVVHVQHVSARAGATFFLPHTAGVEIHDAVKPAGDEIVVRKHHPNAFRDTTLSAHLRGMNVRQLVVAGMMTHMCVDATARAAADQGYQCRIVQDGCATRDLNLGDERVSAGAVQTAFLAALNGAYGRVLSASAMLDELEDDRF